MIIGVSYGYEETSYVVVLLAMYILIIISILIFQISKIILKFIGRIMNMNKEIKIEIEENKLRITF